MYKKNLSVLCAGFAFFCFSPAFAYCDNPIACEEEVLTGVDSDPQLLSGFEHGCYGLDKNDLTPVLHSEDENVIGYFYLVHNPSYTEGSVLNPYNIVLCENRKDENDFFLPFSVVFPQTQASIEKGESYSDFFQNTVSIAIRNSYNGNFSVKVLSNAVVLFKSGKLGFENEETRYNLSNISFIESENESNALSTPSLTIGLFSDSGMQRPTLKNLDVFEKCEEKTNEITDNIFLDCGLFANLEAPYGEKFTYTFKALGEGALSFSMEDVFVNDETDSDSIPECTNGHFLKEYVDFDENTNTLSQKDSVEIPSGVSCTFKVSIFDTVIETQEVSKEVNTDNVILAESDKNTQSTNGVVIVADAGTIQTSSFEFYTTLSVYTPAVSNVVVSPVSSTGSSSASSGGGQYEDTIQRLRSGVGYKTIGEESKNENSGDEIDEESVTITCPEKKYTRYADQRGFGVSLDLFEDANPEDKAYKALIDLAEQKIVSGDAQNGFARLSSTLSRAEFVKIMTIAREDTLLLGDCLLLSQFDDVHADDWFTPFVQNLESKSIVKGYAGNIYSPEKAINIAEAYKVIALSFGYISLESAEKASHNRGVEWYVPYTEALENSGVIPSWLKEVDKNTSLTRGDAFVIVSNVLLQKDWLKNINW